MTHLSSPLLHYTVREDTTLVYKAFHTGMQSQSPLNYNNNNNNCIQFKGTLQDCLQSPHCALSTIIIIIIVFKGTLRDCLQSPHCTVNCLQQVCSSGPGAIVCKSCATHRALTTHAVCHHATCHVVRRESSAIKYHRV